MCGRADVENTPLRQWSWRLLAFHVCCAMIIVVSTSKTITKTNEYCERIILVTFTRGHQGVGRTPFELHWTFRAQNRHIIIINTLPKSVACAARDILFACKKCLVNGSCTGQFLPTQSVSPSSSIFMAIHTYKY